MTEMATLTRSYLKERRKKDLLTIKNNWLKAIATETKVLSREEQEIPWVASWLQLNNRTSGMVQTLQSADSPRSRECPTCTPLSQVSAKQHICGWLDTTVPSLLLSMSSSLKSLSTMARRATLWLWDRLVEDPMPPDWSQLRSLIAMEARRRFRFQRKSCALKVFVRDELLST